MGRCMQLLVRRGLQGALAKYRPQLSIEGRGLYRADFASTYVDEPKNSKADPRANRDPTLRLH